MKLMAVEPQTYRAMGTVYNYEIIEKYEGPNRWTKCERSKRNAKEMGKSFPAQLKIVYGEQKVHEPISDIITSSDLQLEHMLIIYAPHYHWTRV